MTLKACSAFHRHNFSNFTQLHRLLDSRDRERKVDERSIFMKIKRCWLYKENTNIDQYLPETDERWKPPDWYNWYVSANALSFFSAMFCCICNQLLCSSNLGVSEQNCMFIHSCWIRNCISQISIVRTQGRVITDNKVECDGIFNSILWASGSCCFSDKLGNLLELSLFAFVL